MSDADDVEDAFEGGFEPGVVGGDGAAGLEADALPPAEDDELRGALERFDRIKRCPVLHGTPAELRAALGSLLVREQRRLGEAAGSLNPLLLQLALQEDDRAVLVRVLACCVFNALRCDLNLRIEGVRAEDFLDCEPVFFAYLHGALDLPL